MSQNHPSMPSKDAFQRLLDGLQTLIREHLALARVEAKEDLRAMGRDLAYGAAGAPPLAVGYLMLMIALAYLLAQWLASWAAFGIVAVVNLAAGIALTIVCRKKLKENHPQALSGMGEELQRNKVWLSSLTESTRPQPDDKVTDPNAARLT
jgi:hypothetical protein